MLYRHLSFSAVVALTTTLAAASYCAPAQADDNAEARVYFEQGNRALTRGMNARGARRTRFIEEALAAKESLDADAALETAKKRSEAEPENDNRKPRRRGP